MKIQYRCLTLALTTLISTMAHAEASCVLYGGGKLKIVEVTRPGVNDLVGNDFDPVSLTIVGYKKNADGTRSAARFTSTTTSIVNSAHKGELQSINANLQIIGTGDTASGYSSYFYVPGQTFGYLQDALPDAVGNTFAKAMNRNGQIVGCTDFKIPYNSYPYNTFLLNLASFWQSSTSASQLIPTALPALPTQTISACMTDISDNAKAVGNVQEFGGGMHEGPAAVYWSKVPTNTYNFQVIPALARDGDWNTATAVNESGMVVGTSQFQFQDFFGDSTGYVWTPGEYARAIMIAKVYPGNVIRYFPAYPTDINNRGIAVGNSSFGPFLSAVHLGWWATNIDQLISNRALIPGNPTIVSATKVRGEKILVQGRLKNSTIERTYVLTPDC